MYLYGEPIPEPLREFFPLIPLLKSLANDTTQVAFQQLITSCLLWVAVTGNVSPLHYDLSVFGLLPSVFSPL
jgi:hypothetical protein